MKTLDTSDISWIIQGERYGVRPSSHFTHGSNKTLSLSPSKLKRDTNGDIIDWEYSLGSLDAVRQIPSGSVVLLQPSKSRLLKSPILSARQKLAITIQPDRPLVGTLNRSFMRAPKTKKSPEVLAL